MKKIQGVAQVVEFLLCKHEDQSHPQKRKFSPLL
jgi:hypothetical protein